MQPINFNSNSYSYLSPEVQDVMKNAVTVFANSKTKGFGSDYKIQAEIEEIRTTIADELHLNSHEVFFNHSHENAEIEIINWSILILGIETIITSRFENSAKLEYLKRLEDLGKTKLYLIETSEYGEINTDNLRVVLKSLNCRTLVSLSHANYFSGILLPLKELSRICKKNHILFHLGANLTFGRYNIDFQHVKPDIISFDSSLLNGPTGIGCTVINESIAVNNMQFKDLKKTVEATENKNAVQISGFKLALSKALDEIESNQKKISALKSYFISEIDKNLRIKVINTQFKKNGLFNQIAFWINKSDFGEYICEKLDLNGISISNNDFPLKSWQNAERSYVNIGISANCIIKEIDYFIEVLQKLRKEKM